MTFSMKTPFSASYTDFSVGVSGATSTPNCPRTMGSPPFRDSMTVLVVASMGMAKPTPMFPLIGPLVKMAWLTPMTSARMLTSGPPLLPGLIGASVWIRLRNGLPSMSDSSCLSVALTTPTVTVGSNRSDSSNRPPTMPPPSRRMPPNGNPTAIAHEPTFD